MNENSSKFTAVYQANFYKILGYVVRRAGFKDLAADVTAEVFATAWRRIDDVPDGKEATLWLYGVARRVLSNQHRSITRKTSLIEKLQDNVCLLAYQIPDMRETQLDIQALLAQLNKEDFEIITLRYWEDLKNSEIAIVLEIPESTVRTKLFKIRQKLKAQLETDGVVEGGLL